jgi:hypothetical protein
MTINLLKHLLIGQLKHPADIQIANIRTTQGSLFASRFECDATIEGDLTESRFLESK